MQNSIETKTYEGGNKKPPDGRRLIFNS